MKKTAVAAVLCVTMLTGCAADESGGITQQDGASSRAYSTEAVTEPPQTEPYTEEPEPAAETAETAESVDAVRLVEQLDSEFLGLPESDRVYIFMDKQEKTEINSGTFYGVSCYDDADGQLRLICDFYISADGLTAYRYYPEDGSYRLLPEQQEFAGFDPETQSAEDIFAQANALYSAVYGELDFDAGAEPVTTQLGDMYPVSDTRLDTVDKLTSALERYFSGDVLAELLKGSDRVIAGEDGSMYCLEHYGGVSGYLGTEYALEELMEKTAVYSATARFEYEAGNITEKSFICTAEKFGNGWRFTQFEYPY